MAKTPWEKDQKRKIVRNYPSYIGFQENNKFAGQLNCYGYEQYVNSDFEATILSHQDELNERRKTIDHGISLYENVRNPEVINAN